MMHSIMKSVNGTMLAILLLLCPNLSADVCPHFTEEQVKLIHKAYAKGYPSDLGYTLAAITWQESFVWKYVQRINPRDGKYGSYGVSQVNLETAMWITKEKSSHRALSELAPKLMRDDDYSWELSLIKLTRTKGDWRTKVTRYNGRGKLAEKYYESIKKKVSVLKSCFYLKEELEPHD